MLDYKVIEQESASDLEKAVQQSIEDGWQLQGGVNVATHMIQGLANTVFSQAVVREHPAEATRVATVEVTMPETETTQLAAIVKADPPAMQGWPL